MIVLYNPKEKVRLRIPYLPLSLMAVGTSLEKAGFEVTIIDARTGDDVREHIISSLDNHPLLFGITLMTGSVIYDALEIAEFVKELNPDLRIVAGGVHPTLLPEQTLENELIDIAVIGAGEKTCVEIAKTIKANKPLDSIPSIAFKREGKIIVNHKETNLNPEYFTRINYSIVDKTKYIKRESTGRRCLDYLSTRGCPHTCTYCSISKIWDRKMLYYNSKDIVDDLEAFIGEHNIDSIHFLDDNFFVNKKRVEEICDAVIERAIKINFWAMCRISYFIKYDESFLLKLKKAGFHTLNFGAESGSQFILDNIKKQFKVEQIVQTAEICHKYGFRGQFSFMTAFPFDRKEDPEMTMTLMEKIHSINKNFDCQLFPFIPFPETELFYDSIQYGFNPPQKLEDWGELEYGKIPMPWLTGKEKKRNDTLATIAWFAFTSETAVKLEGVKGKAFQFLGKIARLRWKFRFFNFPVEWKIINFLARRW